MFCKKRCLLKKSLWHRCFPVNCVKFLRAPFSQNTSGRLLLKIEEWSECIPSWHFWPYLHLLQSGKVKHELQVTSSNPRVTSSEPRVTNSNSQVTSSNPRVTSSNLRVTSSNPRVTSSNPRVPSSNPRVTSSNPRVTSSNPRIIKSTKTQVGSLKSSSFLKILSPKLLGNSWGNSHVQFLVIISCFTFPPLHVYGFSKH